MRSQKSYSNATFTKRVDHIAGSHRTPRSPLEPAKCKICGALYTKRRWVSANTVQDVNEQLQLREYKTVICPACEQMKNKTAAGFLYLEGAFLNDHREEIERLLKNEAERAAGDNPLARIMSLETNEKGQLIIKTTTEHLAARLGKAVEKAFCGNVRYDFSHENKLSRVYWKRD